MNPQPTQPYPRRSRFTTMRASLEIWRPANRVIVLRLSGHTDMDIMNAIFQGVENCIQDACGQQIIEFYDLWDNESYDTKARTSTTRWLSTNAKHIEQIHFLVRSRIVSMALSMIGRLHQGLIVSYANRANFDAALGATLRRVRDVGPKA